MCPQLCNLLRLAVPGVLHSWSNLFTKQIPIDDRALLLTPPRNDRIQTGEWVCVLRGTYRGDIGYVTRGPFVWFKHSDGRVQQVLGYRILLVPRMQPLSHSDVTGIKRPRSKQRPPLTLFDLNAARRHGQEPTDFEAKSHHYGDKLYQYGLLVKDVSPYQISSFLVFMPTHVYSLFRASGHPKVINAPYPHVLEWEFVTGDKVSIVEGVLCGKFGVVQEVGPTHLQVMLKNPEELVDIPQSYLRKSFNIGDFVKVLRGVSKDRTGWVLEIQNSNMEVLESSSPVKGYRIMENTSEACVSFQLPVCYMLTPTRCSGYIAIMQSFVNRQSN